MSKKLLAAALAAAFLATGGVTKAADALHLDANNTWSYNGAAPNNGSDSAAGTGGVASLGIGTTNTVTGGGSGSLTTTGVGSVDITGAGTIGSLTMADSTSSVVTNNGTDVSLGATVLGTTGKLTNTGKLTLTSTFTAGGTAQLTNAGGNLTIASDNIASAVIGALGATTPASVGDITVTGQLGSGITFANASNTGSLSVSGQATAQAIDAGSLKFTVGNGEYGALTTAHADGVVANGNDGTTNIASVGAANGLKIDGSSNVTVAGAVAQNVTITNNGTGENVFNGAITGNLTANAGTNTINDSVTDITANAGSEVILGTGGSMTGNLETALGGTFTNNKTGDLTFTGGTGITNNGTINNTGKIVIEATGSYTGSTTAIINNAGAALDIDRTIGGLANALTALDNGTNKNIGAVTLTGTPGAATAGINIADATGGSLDATVITGSSFDINVGNADLALGGGTYSAGLVANDITASGVTLTGTVDGNLLLTGNNNISTVVDGDINVNGGTTNITSGGGMTNGDLKVNNSGAILNNDGNVNVSSGHTVINKGAINNTANGTFTLGAGSTYDAGNDGAITNAGNFNVDVKATNNAKALSAMTGNITTVTLTDTTHSGSDLSGAVNMVGATGGLLDASVLKGSQYDINVADANLKIGEGTFEGELTATKVIAGKDGKTTTLQNDINGALEVVGSNATTYIQKDVSGDLDVSGGSTAILSSDSTLSGVGTEVAVHNGGKLTNDVASLDLSDKDVDNDGTITNNAGKTIQFLNGAGSYADSTNGKIVNLGTAEVSTKHADGDTVLKDIVKNDGKIGTVALKGEGDTKLTAINSAGFFGADALAKAEEGTVDITDFTGGSDVAINVGKADLNAGGGTFAAAITAKTAGFGGIGETATINGKVTTDELIVKDGDELGGDSTVVLGATADLEDVTKISIGTSAATGDYSVLKLAQTGAVDTPVDLQGVKVANNDGTMDLNGQAVALGEYEGTGADDAIINNNLIDFDVDTYDIENLDNIAVALANGGGDGAGSNDVGTINIDGQLDGQDIAWGGIFDGGAGNEYTGDLTIEDYQDKAGDINVGDLGITVNGGKFGTIIADHINTLGKFIIDGSNSPFTTDLNVDIAGTDKFVEITDAGFIGASETAGADGQTLDLMGDDNYVWNKGIYNLTGTGQTLALTGDRTGVLNEGEFNIGADSIIDANISLVDGSTDQYIINADGTMNIAGAADLDTITALLDQGFNILDGDDEVMDAGIINLNGNVVSNFDIANAEDGVVTIEDVQNTTGLDKVNIDVGDADLVLAAEGNKMDGDLAGYDITFAGAGTYKGAVTAGGDLTALSGSTFSGRVDVEDVLQTKGVTFNNNTITADTAVVENTIFNNGDLTTTGKLEVKGGVETSLLGSMLTSTAGNIEISGMDNKLYGGVNAVTGTTILMDGTSTIAGDINGKFKVANGATYVVGGYNTTIKGAFSADPYATIKFDGLLSDPDAMAIIDVDGGSINLDYNTKLDANRYFVDGEFEQVVFTEEAVDNLTITGGDLTSYLDRWTISDLTATSYFREKDGEIYFTYEAPRTFEEILDDQGIGGDREIYTDDTVSVIKDSTDELRKIDDATMAWLEENDPDAANALKLYGAAGGNYSYYDLEKGGKGTNAKAAYALAQWTNGKDWAGAVEAVTDTVRNFNRAITSRAYNIGHLLGATEYDECGNVIESCAGYKNRIWAGYTGFWGENDGRSYDRGYKYDAHGINVGFDRVTSSGVGFGAAFGYSRGDYENYGSFNQGDKSKLNNYSFGLFGSYNHASGFFTTLSATYTYTKYKMNNSFIDGSLADPSLTVRADHANYHGDSWSAGGKFGYDFKPMANLTITPTAGLYYYSTRTNRFDTDLGRRGMKYSRHTVEMPIDVTVKYDIAVGCDSTLSLIGTGGYAYNFHNKGTKVSNFSVGNGYYDELPSGGIAGGDRFAKSGRSSWNVGGGAQFRYRNMDVGVHYEYYGRSDYKSHSLNANVGFSF